MPEVQTETLISSRRVYEGRVLSLRVDDVRLANGIEARREVVEHRGAVAIVPMVDRETVILVRQYRTSTGRVMLEVPAGSLNEGESPEICAHRELAEETKFDARHMQYLYGTFMAPGYCTEVIHAFLALGLEPCERDADDDEFIELVRLPLDEAIGLIGKGELQDAKSVAALLYVARILPTIEF
ncbi:MAG: NUDIX domain-containing protein [Capsulimonadaceae bacterium]